MRALLTRGLVAWTLACWLLSACMGQVMWLHVETEHNGRHQTEPRGVPWLALHTDHHSAHEHELLSTGPGLPSPRLPTFDFVLVMAPLQWSEPAELRAQDRASIPRPRGSPQPHTVLLI